MKWEIKKAGKTVVESPLKNCGYTVQQIKSLTAAGYRLFCDGKAVKKNEIP